MRRPGSRMIATTMIVLGSLTASSAAAQAPRSQMGGAMPGGGPGTVAGAVPPGPVGMPPGGPGMPPPPPDTMLVSILIRGANLSSEQHVRVGAIMSARQATLRMLIERLRKTEDELADGLLAQGPASDFQSTIARVSQLREQLLQESVRAAVEVRGILTPEQLARATYVKDRLRALQMEMRQLTQSARP